MPKFLIFLMLILVHYLEEKKDLYLFPRKMLDLILPELKKNIKVTFLFPFKNLRTAFFVMKIIIIKTFFSLGGKKYHNFRYKYLK